MGDPSCCPCCRSRPVSTVVDRTLKDVKRVVSQVYSSDLPELQWYSILYDPRVHFVIFISNIDRQDRDLKDVKDNSKCPKIWPVMIRYIVSKFTKLHSLYQQSVLCCQLGHPQLIFYSAFHVCQNEQEAGPLYILNLNFTLLMYLDGGSHNFNFILFNSWG